MNRRQMMQWAAALGGAAVVRAGGRASAAPAGPAAPLPGWSCEFKLHRAEATSLVVNGQLWCRHAERDLGYTWVLPEGEVLVPLPEKYRYQKELTLVGVSSPWGDESMVLVYWNGILKKKLEFGKSDVRQLAH